MEKIAKCESGGKQFYQDGTLVTNKNYRDGVHWSTDYGYFQINDYYHLERAEELGLDIMTEQGNKDYALLLFDADGTSHWQASKGCWLQ